MTSRLYRTTRPLGAQVALILRRIGVEEVGTPTTVVLIALYVAGLILLDGRQTQTRVALFLPGRCSRRSSARGCTLATSSSTPTTRLGGSPSW